MVFMGWIVGSLRRLVGLRVLLEEEALRGFHRAVYNFLVWLLGNKDKSGSCTGHLLCTGYKLGFACRSPSCHFAVLYECDED